MRPFAKAILSIGTVFVSAIAWCQTDADLMQAISEYVTLPEADLEELLRNGELTNMYSAPAVPKLAPVFLDTVRRDLANLDPALGVEVLVLHRHPGESFDLVTAYRTLQAISTMEGIEYFSASRDRFRVLFHESYVVDGPDTRNRLPDPVVPVVPAREQVFVFQRDSSFGNNVYELTYSADGPAVLLSMKNITRMLYRGVVPAVGPEQLMFHIVAVPGDGFTVLYGSSGADTTNMLGMEERARRSFYNRIVALHTWYRSQVELVDRERVR